MSDDNNDSSVVDQLRTKHTPKWFKLLLLCLCMVSLLTAAGVCIYAFLAIRTASDRLSYLEKSTKDNILELGTNLKQLADELQRLWPALSQLPTSDIDLTGQGWQELGHGLRVTDISVAQHLTGVKVKGKIVNILSVRQSKISFSIQIGNTTKTFEVTKDVLPGYSAAFEVYVPDVPLLATNRATIQYQQSYMSTY